MGPDIDNNLCLRRLQQWLTRLTQPGLSEKFQATNQIVFDECEEKTISRDDKQDLIFLLRTCNSKESDAVTVMLLKSNSKILTSFGELIVIIDTHP